MNVSPSLLAAADRAGICASYYELCARHPLSASSGLKKVPYKEILAAASPMALSKAKGPGTVFSVDDLPTGVALDFIIQSGGTVETGLAIATPSGSEHTTFAILCNLATAYASLPAPQPAYPRPVCSSAEAFVSVFTRLRDLSLKLAREVGHAG